MLALLSLPLSLPSIPSFLFFLLSPVPRAFHSGWPLAAGLHG